LIKRTLSWTAIVALGATLAAAGYWLLFTYFMVYDDEGYVLLSLRNFSLHGGLYDLVYSQYGPFPYLLYDALHRALGFAFTNTAARWITLINWSGTAAACAILVGRQTRSFLWAAFTLAGVFTYLWVMVHEPVHPGSLLSLLVAVGVWLGAEAWGAGRLARFAAITALAGAALAFTKINVGVFFLGATFAWLAVNTTPVRAARALTWLVALGCAVLPFGLMNALLGAPWARLFALVFVCGAVGVLLAARAVARPVATARDWTVFFGVLLGATLVLAALTLLRGTSLHGLIAGILLEPMKHPGVYFYPVRWEPGAQILALVSLGFAGWSVRAGWLNDARWQRGIALVRVIVTAIFLCTPLQIMSVSLAVWATSYGISLAWLFVVPLREKQEGAAMRAWVALMLVFQLLHAYPVAGTQINWGTYLWVPLLALGTHDAVPLLRAWLGARSRVVLGLGATITAVVTVVMAAQLAKIGRSRYEGNPRLEIPGAENLRLDADSTYVMRILNENLRTHADVLFSLPGLYSANLWTDLPTPTLANATHWFSLLSEPQQQEIITQLTSASRPALLVERDVLNYLEKADFHPHGPLHDWLMANFEPNFTLDGYELWLRRGRHIAALSTVRFTSIDATKQELTVTIVAPARPVTQFALCDYTAPDQPYVAFAANYPVTVTPLNLDGEATGPAQVAPWPLVFSGVVRLTVRAPKLDPRIDLSHLLLVMRDANGAIVSESRALP
jgi:hypothetical protein